MRWFSWGRRLMHESCGAAGVYVSGYQAKARFNHSFIKEGSGVDRVAPQNTSGIVIVVARLGHCAGLALEKYQDRFEGWKGGESRSQTGKCLRHWEDVGKN